MIKKLILSLLFISSVANAQYSIKGTMTPPEKDDWVALYKVEGAKQIFVKHTTIKVSTFDIGGQKQEIGTFEFNLPNDAKKGVYRAQYRQTGAGFVDFFFNNEDVEMVFNPQYPDQSILFSKSLENRIYHEYLESQVFLQRRIDSLQEAFIKYPSKSTKKAYKKEVNALEDTQSLFENKSGGMYANRFIKASKIENPSSPFENNQEYRDYVVDNFFNNIDFEDEILMNSPFFINKISDYIFYLNVATTQLLQQRLYKKSIRKVMEKAEEPKLRKMFCEYLINSFANKRNSEIVDWIFKDYYDKLPEKFYDQVFKDKKLEALRVSVGRKAPNFSWTDEGVKKSLWQLSDGEKYLLIFWSTQCSHCVEEIPEVHKAMESLHDVSVVAFAIEENDLDFNSWKKNKIYNFHNVIGTHPENKFKNKTVQDYLIEETPTYFVLDKDKKIIAVPNTVKDVKDYFHVK